MLIPQLIQPSLLLKQPLSLLKEALPPLPLLTIARGSLLLLMLPITLPPVVVAVAIETPIPVSVTFQLPATRGFLLLSLLTTQRVLPLLFELTLSL